MRLIVYYETDETTTWQIFRGGGGFSVSIQGDFLPSGSMPEIDASCKWRLIITL